MSSLLTFGIASAYDMTRSVYFMKTNSTAKIYAKYILHEFGTGYWNLSPKVYLYHLPQGLVSANGSVTVTADPNLIPINQNDTNVTFTIITNNNSGGIYEMETHDVCYNHQTIVVGLNESQVDPDILARFTGAVCAEMNMYPPLVNIIKHTGITSKTFYEIFNAQGIKILPPLEQVRSGTSPSEIICNYGLQRLFKAEDGSPACVKPDTARILVERGWAD